MKNLFTFLILAILQNGVFAQTKQIEGFLGIKFGSSQKTVINTVKQKGGILEEKETTPLVLSFKNVRFGHRIAPVFLVKFVNDKAFEADFFFIQDPEAKTIQYYDDLASDISDVYGPGREFKNFTEPYKAGDGDEIMAIKTGHADYDRYWKTENGNMIHENITSTLVVKLDYQDEVLVQLAIEQRKANEKSDY